MTPVLLDGSIGEGGGQILRSSLALSAITGRRLELKRIRSRRAKPGLARQHLTCVRAAAELVGATLSGAELRSKRLTFEPTHDVRAGRYRFDIGTAGSTSLVLQTVLWPLALASGESEVTIEGGTHNPMSPTVDFLVRAFFPLIAAAGVKIELELERHGFYPGGGGRIRARIQGRSGASPEALHLTDRGEPGQPRARILLADLPAHIAEREAAVLVRHLGLPEAAIEVDRVSGHGPGNVVMIELPFANVCEVITGFGEKRVRAELVASRAATDAHSYLASDAPIGDHLADQLILPLALAGRGEIACTTPTEHTRTNIDVVQAFVGTRFALAREPERRSCYRLVASSAINGPDHGAATPDS